jgi:hypothetical protein
MEKLRKVAVDVKWMRYSPATESGKVDLIDSSKALDVRVWLDGIYTDIGDEQVHGDWMNDRDVYFKVEGRVDKRNGS